MVHRIYILTTNKSPTPLVMESTVMCAILGSEKEVFPINMDQTRTVGELKSNIKQAKHETLASFEASDLKLYNVNNIPVPDTGLYHTDRVHISTHCRVQ